MKMKNEQQPDDTEELSPILTTFDTSVSSPPPSLGHGAHPAAAGPAATHQHQHQTYSSGGGKAAQTTHWKSDTRNFRIQGWDPVLIISQILAIQALHYVILCLITPPMLTMFAKPGPLEYEGGARNVAMIMDWRAMAGSSTLHPVIPAIPGASRLDGWAGFGRLPNPLARNPLRIGNRRPTITLNSGRSANNSLPDSSGLLHRLSLGLGPDWASQNLNYSARNSQLLSDDNRSWVISIAWLISSLIGVFVLYEIVRRPKQIMDHSLTICLNHLILTTYYSAHLPSSLWFYFVLLASAVLQILLTEPLCVQREFRDGLGVGWKVDNRPHDC